MRTAQPVIDKSFVKKRDSFGEMFQFTKRTVDLKTVVGIDGVSSIFPGFQPHKFPANCEF